MAFPFYFFDPGSPQVADVFGLMIVGLSIRDIFLSKKDIFLKSLAIFVFATLAINSLYAIYFGDFSFLKKPINYLYCYLLSLAIFVNLKKPWFIKITKFGIIATLVFQLLVAPFSPDYDNVRTIIYFNNPNQLALWSICMLCIASILFYFQYHMLLAITIACLFLGALSASKAGLAGLAIMLLLLLLKKPKYLIALGFGLIIGLGVFFEEVNDFVYKLSVVDKVISRIETDGTPYDDNLAGRGFARMWEYPIYNLYGAGEGKNIRFDTKYEHEIHGTFGNILFSYGIIPFAIYMFFIWGVYYRNGLKIFVYLLPLFAFAFGHMTLRIPLFWISIIVAYSFWRMPQTQ